MNELSPRKYPRSPIRVQKTPPRWTKPNDVMKKHKVRLKQSALLERINRSPTQPAPVYRTLINNTVTAVKRSNPFKIFINEVSNCKKFKEEPKRPSIGSLLILDTLGFSDSQKQNFNLADSVPKLNDISEEESYEAEEDPRLCNLLPVDWTLRYKMRFISVKPFPWSQTLKTCEEASGLTGFVRCLENSAFDGPTGLDTSPNAKFHQCCLFWQHPSLSWLEVFPRNSHRMTSDSKQSLGSIRLVKESLHRDWSESFRSLFQLVRARHCPYFYMIANVFTCLFRAVGLSGSGQINISICPTTRGFRKLLDGEGIRYTLPLRQSNSRQSKDNSEDGLEEGKSKLDNEDDDEDIDDGGKDWLASLGIEEEEINKISNSQEVYFEKQEEEMEGSEQTLVYIEGTECQSLFNFLINCRSMVANSGPLTGIPPTLISPVAFSGGTLVPLKVRESSVKMGNERYFSIEFKGPILPHTVHSLCELLQLENDKFSVTLANVESTKAFSLSAEGEEKGPYLKENLEQSQIFSVESLSDCGLGSRLLTKFCSNNIKCYDSIKCTNGDFVYS